MAPPPRSPRNRWSPAGDRRCYPAAPNEEFLRFLKQVAKTYPRKKLHIVCDNYATHKHPNVKAWLARTRDLAALHPTSGSWLNMVEIFFGIITREAIRRGTSASAKELIAAPRHLHRRLVRSLRAFVWNKTAEQKSLPARPRKKTLQKRTRQAPPRVWGSNELGDCRYRTDVGCARVLVVIPAMPFADAIGFAKHLFLPRLGTGDSFSGLTRLVARLRSQASLDTKASSG